MIVTVTVLCVLFLAIGTFVGWTARGVQMRRKPKPIPTPVRSVAPEELTEFINNMGAAFKVDRRHSRT